MPISSASRFLNTGQDSGWRILKHYVDNAKENVNLSSIENVGVDEIAIMKGHDYET